jgi:transcription antitermination factor NusG
MPFWAVCRACPQREHFARDRLIDAGFEVLLPLVMTRGRITPLFSTYLFTKLLDDSGAGWHIARRTFGVMTMLIAADRPVRCPDTEIGGLRSRMDPQGFVRLPAPPKPRRFIKGEAVRIIGGPMQGLAAIHSGMTRGQREVVLLAMLGRQAKIAIDRAFVAAR